MHSIELLLDAEADAAVRAEWATLSRAGLPSLAEHTGATNAPHVTLLAHPRLDDESDDALCALFAAALPLRVELGAPLVFGQGRRGLALVRAVVPTAALLELHREVVGLTRLGDEPAVAHTLPDAWTPHVALARRLTPADVGTALEALADAEPALSPTTLAAGRRWDSDARAVVTL
jgi:2'-5' RNA ligase